MSKVADATFEVWERLGTATMFANPGSTEIPLLARPAGGMRFVLGLHEGSVVGTATGYALATGEPALAVLHTTAGFGNAVGAIATARVNRAPMVVVVGQQDRRHLAQRPFLAGDLEGLAGTYPVWSNQPVKARDVPGTIERAWHEARTRRGPAVVVVPMDDWEAGADPTSVRSARVVIDASGVDASRAARLTEMLNEAVSPALVVGSDADYADAWEALVALAEKLDCPVWQEPFGARAGFPQDHRLFAGHLPAGRARVRQVLAPHDLVLVVGAPAFRQYPYEPGPLVPDGTQVAMVVDDPQLAHHSASDLALIGSIHGICRAVAEDVKARNGVADAMGRPREAAAAATATTDLRPKRVFAALADRIDPDTVVVEESPSSRPELHRLLPARRPLGFVSAAMGGLGFGLPAAVGLRMGMPERPVVALVGDGSSLYGIQALWTAAHYGVGALFVVLSNGRYTIMDRLAERNGHRGPWPAFEEVSVSTLAAGFGCPSRRVDGAQELDAVLDEVVPSLRTSQSPLLIEVPVTDEETFNP